jgi:hypothetical protein
MPPAKARGAVPAGLPVHRVLNHGALLCTVVRCGHKHGVPKYVISRVQKCNQITLHFVNSLTEDGRRGTTSIRLPSSVPHTENADRISGMLY